MSFENYGLNKSILKSISSLGFEAPTAVQEKTLPYLLENEGDLLALAQTGTGKTAAFGLPILNKLRLKEKQVQALVLCPTRELCVQISEDLKAYGKQMKGLSITAIYGGASIEKQIKDIKAGCHIVVATPGRILDLIRRKKIDLTTIENLVLDEADEMLAMGFQEDLNAILEKTPFEKNVLLFSATMPKPLVAIAMNYMVDPHEIIIGEKNSGAKNVEHLYYRVAPKEKYAALKRVVDSHPEIYGIVFCRTRNETKVIAERLMQDQYSADALHGDLSHAGRETVMKKFRSRGIQLLVATDIAARGLDIDDISHVVSYNLPDELEVYTHRSGRTGRANKSGVSMVLATAREKKRIDALEKLIKKPFIESTIPTGKEVCKIRLYHLVDQMTQVEVDEKEIAEFLPDLFKKLEEYSKEEIIKKFISIQFNRFLEYYKGSKDLNDSSSGEERSGKWARIFLNIGRKDGIRNKHVLRLINDSIKNEKPTIGTIDVMVTYSFFEVRPKQTAEVLEVLNGKKYRGRIVEAALTESSPKNKSKNKSKKPSKSHRKDIEKRRKKS